MEAEELTRALQDAARRLPPRPPGSRQAVAKRVRRQRERLGLTALAVVAVIGAAIGIGLATTQSSNRKNLTIIGPAPTPTTTATSAPAQTITVGQVAAGVSVTTITLPQDYWFNQISFHGGTVSLDGQSGPLALTGTVANTGPAPQCVKAAVLAFPLTVGPVTQLGCTSPALDDSFVAPQITYLPKAPNNGATISIVRLDPNTGKLSVGPVVMTFSDVSDARPVVAYGGAWMWIYDVDTTNGPETIQVSATDGHIQDTIPMPALYRPVATANDDGLWLGNSIQGSPSPYVLYHVIPGARSATGVLASAEGQSCFWLIGIHDRLWMGVGPIFTDQTIWGFDGLNAHPVFNVADQGFAPTAVVGDLSSGLWTVVPHPPLTTVPKPPYPDQDVVRIDLMTGHETVVATLKNVTIPISLQGGTIPAQLAVANGSLYVLEPPFQANGYEGFATLTKVTPG